MGRFTSTDSATGDARTDSKGQPPRWSNKYDPKVTKEVINSQPFLHLTFPVQGGQKFPAVSYLVGKFFDSKEFPPGLYVHGHLEDSIKSLFTDAGVAVTIAASKVNSYTLGFSGFATGYTWANAVVNGVAHLLPVEGLRDQRLAVMNSILESMIPGRSKNVRDLGDDVDQVSMIRIDVDEKESHTHSNLANLGFEMKVDVDNPDVSNNYWEGAIPVWQAYGDPIAGEHNTVPTPQYLTDFVRDQNAKNKKKAEDAASAAWPYDPIKF